MAWAHIRIVARVGRLVGWNHCPRCAAALENDGRRARCSACGFVAYAHSDPTACALVFDDEGRVLLARRAREPDRGKWDVPGGFIEEDEAPLDALRRELLEETGLDIEPLEFVGAGPTATEMARMRRRHSISTGTHASSRASRAADDVVELAWFPLDDLPPDEELAFRNVAALARSDQILALAAKIGSPDGAIIDVVASANRSVLTRAPRARGERRTRQPPRSPSCCSGSPATRRGSRRRRVRSRRSSRSSWAGSRACLGERGSTCTCLS